jgi:hypothetical protein
LKYLTTLLPLTLILSIAPAGVFKDTPKPDDKTKTQQAPSSQQTTPPEGMDMSAMMATRPEHEALNKMIGKWSKSVVRMVDDDHFVMEMHDLALGANSKVMEIEYTREK